MPILSKALEKVRSGKLSMRYFYILIALSLVLKNVSGIVNFPGIISSPQFRSKLDAGFIKSILAESPWTQYSYYIYFLIDFFWAPVFLYGIFLFVSNNAFQKKSVITGVNIKYLKYFAILILLALGFDYGENIIYAFTVKHNAVVYWTKYILYLLVIAIWLYVLIKKYQKHIVPVLKDFFSSAWFSVIIIVIMGALLPTATQVNSIVVNLYDHPRNLILLLLFAPIYAVMLAHYPSYFNIDKGHRKWYRAKNFRFWKLGTIFYKYNEDYQEKEKGYIEGISNFLFRMLGVFFYASLFYLIGYTSEVNFDWYISMFDLAFALWIIGVFMLFVLRKVKNDWLNTHFVYLYHHLPNFYDGDINISDDTEESLDKYKKSIQENTPYKFENEDSIESIKIHISRYMRILIITLIAHLLLVYLFIFQDYTVWTASVSLLCVALQMISYVYFRTFRSVFRFTFYTTKLWRAVLNSFYIMRVFDIAKKANEKEIKKFTQMREVVKKKHQVNAFFIGGKHFEQAGLYKLFRWLGFGVHSNNITFLQFTVSIGIVNAIFFFWINYLSDFTLNWNVNAILVILSAFFLYYGIIIVFTKNYIYFKHSLEQFAADNRKLYFRFLKVTGLSLVVFFILTKIFPNEMFTLKPVDQVKSTVTLDNYIEDRAKDSTATRYYIGAYGGGMKANAWTLTVLNKLLTEDQNFMNQTIGISGASGGTIGMINMAAILDQYPNNSKIQDSLIGAISTENILSLDLAHVLGRDTFNRMFVPGIGKNKLQGKDRSTKAMLGYANLVHKDTADYKNIGYREYWDRLYTNYNKRFPILITNTTNVRGNHGIAVSLNTLNDKFQNSFLYQGADDIINLGDKTLTFYDAASTSNRFPVISSAAKIETKGHYNDGGIYENSGLLSVLKLFKAVNAVSEIDNLKQLKQKNVFISISNDKSQYIRKSLRYYLKKKNDRLKLENSSIKTKKLNTNSEVSAILNSLASTEMTPIYVKKELERLEAMNKAHIKFRTIYLPHRYTMADIKSIYGKEFILNDMQVSETVKLLYQCIKENNKDIDSIMGRNLNRQAPIIEPPMSRVLAKGAYQFMVEMLDHPVTIQSLDDILKD